MLCDLIGKISDTFIKEAIASPSLLADMAAMERYMAESYNGRVFIELLQNADDCNSTKIFIKEVNGNIIFANNGRPFDENDVVAISRSGASNKKRGETIGYRGIGFKSTTYLTDEILIYSDKTYFTFSKKACSKKLSIPENNIPMIRIPLLVESIDNTILQGINQLEQLGYTTIFVFKNAKIEEFLEEIKQIDSGMFIFLKNIEECCVEIKPISKKIILSREAKDSGTLIRFLDAENDAWYILSHQNTSVGFRYDVINEKIVPCDEREQVYHSYLPTYDKMLFPVKVNADFSTDPSRKHLVMDSKTGLALADIAENIFCIFNRIFTEDIEINFSEIFSIFSGYGAFSKYNSLLKQQLKNHLTGVLLPLRNKNVVSLNEYKLFPDWFDESEKRFLRAESRYIGNQSLPKDIYEKYKDVDKFIQTYSDSEQLFSNHDIVNMMAEESLVQKMHSEMQGKILAKIIKTEKLDRMTTGNKKSLDSVKVLTNSGVKSLSDIAKNNFEFDTNVKNEITNSVSKSDINWFSKETSIDEKKLSEEVCEVSENSFKSVKKEIKPRIAKWRSAEQQCIDIEKYFGNAAIDVSKQNVGYDVESTTPTGQKRYIEVKSITEEGSFSITNNEYTAAHQFGDNYYICLLVLNNQTTQAIYIKNPLATLNFEKRVRQWEWYCDTYSGESFLFEN